MKPLIIYSKPPHPLEFFLHNIENFLQKICSNKQFWCKEILIFLGIESEDEQLELLLQHENSLPNRKIKYKKLKNELAHLETVPLKSLVPDDEESHMKHSTRSTGAKMGNETNRDGSNTGIPKVTV